MLNFYFSDFGLKVGLAHDGSAHIKLINFFTARLGQMIFRLNYISPAHFFRLIEPAHWAQPILTW